MLRSRRKDFDYHAAAVCLSVFVFANVKRFFSWYSAVMSVLSMRLDSGAIDHRLPEQVKMSY